MHLTNFFTYLPIILALLTACNNAHEHMEAKHREAKADSAALHIAILPVDECLAITAAKNMGLFDSLGVDVRIRNCQAMSDCRKAMETNNVEGIVTDSALNWKFLTSKRSRIHRREQLVEKIIAADTQGVTYKLACLMADSLERRKQNVFIVQVEDLNVRLNMLLSGNVDAAVLPEPFAEEAIKEGAHELKFPKGYMASAELMTFTKSSLKNSNRIKQIKLFEQAVRQVQDSIRKNGKDIYRVR